MHDNREPVHTEGMPTLDQILAERNPPLWELKREREQFSKEALAARDAEKLVFFARSPRERRGVGRLRGKMRVILSSQNKSIFGIDIICGLI